MARNNLFVVLIFLGILANGLGPFGVNGLSLTYYLFTCPLVESIVKVNVDKILRIDPGLAGPLVRMHFHDCFVEGCDGSVLIDSTPGNKAEKDAESNLSLRGFEVIDEIKAEVEKRCPGIVSCADILALVAKDVVLFSGGPMFFVPKGRKDGRRSKAADALVKLPPFTSNASQLIDFVGKLGLTAQDLVALSGAHTLGAARCSSFKHRLKNFNATHDIDPSIDPEFLKVLNKTCAAGDTAEQPFDGSIIQFNNEYFQALQKNKGVLFSDQTLATNPKTKELVDTYANNRAVFFLDFQRAMIKMGIMNVKEGSNGEVRKTCRKIN
ncbi:peroxidase [Lithospermum erythrorhizon]|uniref:Peroxidase n=1 Tax=Lithospermum erythrorhizon TaxID=34254 RepID=A0AAV3NTT5_LITER